MSLVFSAPSKTFLAGEYGVLEGGLCLLAGTEPRFELEVREGRGNTEGFHPQSPAVKLMARHLSFFERLDLEFRDPHAGKGGFGASTAQYLMVFALLSWKNSANDESVRELDIRELSDNYLRDAWDGQGRAPSGADLIGQLKGGLTFFEKKAGKISCGAWPFVDLEPILVRTGVKLPTHEHLRSLRSFDFSPLEPIMSKIQQAWNQGNSEDFLTALDEHRRFLTKAGFVADSTQNLLHDLLWTEGVRSAKGCGAMGADVILALVKPSEKKNFLRVWSERGHELIPLTEKLSSGLQLQVKSRVELGQDPWPEALT